MNAAEWNRMMNTARKLGDEYLEALQHLTRKGVVTIQEEVRQRLHSRDVDMTIAEWTTALVDYYHLTAERQLTQLERNNILRYCFELVWRRARLTKRYQTLAMATAAPKSDPLVQEIDNQRKDLKKSRQTATRTAQTALDSAQRILAAQSIEQYRTEAQDIVVKITNVLETLYERYNAVDDALESVCAELEARRQNVDQRLDKEQLSTTLSSLKALNTEITQVETELGLKTTETQIDFKQFLADLRAKVKRFVRDRPMEYNWVCPKCGWNGTLVMGHKKEGTLINPLDWEWKCPQCRTMIAYDMEHPLFDGKVPFNTMMWDDVKAGKLDFRDMARYLQTSPQHITTYAQSKYGKLPDNVQEAFCEWIAEGQDK